jgi:hypothetical protein
LLRCWNEDFQKKSVANRENIYPKDPSRFVNRANEVAQRSEQPGYETVIDTEPLPPRAINDEEESESESEGENIKAGEKTSNNTSPQITISNKRKATTQQEEEIEEFWTNTTASKSFHHNPPTPSTTRKRKPSKKALESIRPVTGSKNTTCDGCAEPIMLLEEEVGYSIGGNMYCMKCNLEFLESI